MKVNKKQIVMLCLSLVLCLAVFLNWKLLEQDTIEILEPTINESITESSENSSDTDDKTLGQAQYVSSAANSVEEYFTTSRINRRETKDEAIELLKTVVNSESSSSSDIEKANAEITKIAEKTELEGTIENLIKAKGFNDCVVFINGELINVAVTSEGLTPEQAAQINEIVVTQTNMSTSNIKIIEVK